MNALVRHARSTTTRLTPTFTSSWAHPLLLCALLGMTLFAGPAFALKCGETEAASTHNDLQAEGTGQRHSTAADALADAERICLSVLMAKAATLAGAVSCDSSDCWFWEGCNGKRTFATPKISYDRDWAKYDWGRSPIQPCDASSVLSGVLGCATRTVRATVKCKGTVTVQKSCGGCAMCPNKGGDVYAESSATLSLVPSSGSANQPAEIGQLCEAYGNDEAKVADAILSTMVGNELPLAGSAR